MSRITNFSKLALPPREEILLEIDRRRCAESLAEFTRRAWHVLEPATPLAWGWALDAMCEHLEAVSRGQILKLLMNVPPGCMKSLLVGVFWPAWEWGPANLPEKRYISTAHKQELATRDNMKCRRLIMSEWYQRRWPIALVGDQNQKTKFENDLTGFRESMAFTSMTGSRGDRVILDDPLSVDDANSDAALHAAEITFLEALPTRVNNSDSAIVVIMQRLHERDTSGIILDMGLPYVHLCLPMEYEPDRKCVTCLGFNDPRTEPGELLFPERFSQDAVDDLKLTLREYGTAGQLQQRPVPRGGGQFKREWFRTVKAIPVGTHYMRGWDFAASTSDKADYTACVKIGKKPDGRFIIVHAWHDRVSPLGVDTALQSYATSDGHACPISIPQDPGQAGKDQAQRRVLMLAGYKIDASPETGDKVTRSEALAAQAEAGNVDLLEGDWNEAFLNEMCSFPYGAHDDQVDAASRAFSKLCLASGGLKISKDAIDSVKRYRYGR